MPDPTLTDAAQALLDARDRKMDAVRTGSIGPGVYELLQQAESYAEQALRAALAAATPPAPTRIPMAWWHAEKNADGTQHCNHLAHDKYGECGRESGEWSPLYMEVPDA